jgi:hypothetical protein
MPDLLLSSTRSHLCCTLSHHARLLLPSQFSQVGAHPGRSTIGIITPGHSSSIIPGSCLAIVAGRAFICALSIFRAG